MIQHKTLKLTYLHTNYWKWKQQYWQNEIQQTRQQYKLMYYIYVYIHSINKNKKY